MEKGPIQQKSLPASCSLACGLQPMASPSCSMWAPSQIWEKDRTTNNPLVKYRKGTEPKITPRASCSLACNLTPMVYSVLQHVGP